jgi:serine/threonine-protein kinase SRPK3
LLTGSYLFDPRRGKGYSRDDGKLQKGIRNQGVSYMIYIDHLAQMIELMGPMPKEFALSGKHSSEFFTHKGVLRHIHRLKYWSLEDVLHDKYGYRRTEAEEIASFLNPMLAYEHRATAYELVNHPWLHDVEPTLPEEHADKQKWNKDYPWRDWARERDMKRRR